MGPLIEIAWAGFEALIRHPLRSLATWCALVAMLVPFLVGSGLAQGLRAEALASIEHGADLYLSGTQFGRVVPLPLSTAAAVARFDGVLRVTPRVEGGLTLGRGHTPAVVVGLPRDSLPPAVRCIEGRLYADRGANELVVGRQLAQRLNLQVGSVIPPFYKNDAGERVSRVVGIFDADTPLWSANLILTDLETACAFFGQPPQATSLLIECRPGHASRLKSALLSRFEELVERSAEIQPRVVAKDDLEAYVPANLLQQEGVFTLHFVLGFAVSILVVLITSGAGLKERRREIGILKATGWQTDEVLWRFAVESALLSLLGGASAVLIAYIWLKGFNGFWIASVFLAGIDRSPDFRVPFQLAPVPALVAFILALVIVMSGTIYTSWRAATVPPREAMR